MDINTQLQQLRKEYVQADDVRKVIIEAQAKELKEKAKVEHKHTAGMKSYLEDTTYHFVCACGEELGTDYLQIYRA